MDVLNSSNETAITWNRQVNPDTTTMALALYRLAKSHASWLRIDLGVRYPYKLLIFLGGNRLKKNARTSIMGPSSRCNQVGLFIISKFTDLSGFKNLTGLVFIIV